MRKLHGYMTVEASLVMSVVLLVYLFIIRYALWAYDRCILDFDMAALLLRSAGAEETERVWLQEKAEWDREKYIWTQVQEPVLEKKLLQLKITGRGDGGSMGKMGISYSMWNVEPRELLRMKKKPVKENIEEGEEKK